MGTSLSQSRGGWDTGHPPGGRIVLPLIDRYLILDDESGVLSRVSHQSWWYVWEPRGGHEGAPVKWPFRPIPPAPCLLLGNYIQFPSRMATQCWTTEVDSLFRKWVASKAGRKLKVSWWTAVMSEVWSLTNGADLICYFLQEENIYVCWKLSPKMQKSWPFGRTEDDQGVHY